MFDALYIGRFQPFHNGHFNALKAILAKHDRVLVAIGSAQYSYLPDNPLTAGERFEIIDAVLHAEGFDCSKYSLVTVANVDDNDKWIGYLEQVLPKFESVYTGSDIVADLFEKNGEYELHQVDFLEGVNATMIREKALHGEDYSDLVHPVTFEYLQKIGFDERIKNLAKSE